MRKIMLWGIAIAAILCRRCRRLPARSRAVADLAVHHAPRRRREAGDGRGGAAERTVLYWKHPDGAADFSATPKKTPDGRDYLPVYEDQEADFKEAKPKQSARRQERQAQGPLLPQPHGAARHLSGAQEGLDGDGLHRRLRGRGGERLDHQDQPRQGAALRRADRGRRDAAHRASRARAGRLQARRAHALVGHAQGRCLHRGAVRQRDRQARESRRAPVPLLQPAGGERPDRLPDIRNRPGARGARRRRAGRAAEAQEPRPARERPQPDSRQPKPVDEHRLARAGHGRRHGEEGDLRADGQSRRGALPPRRPHEHLGHCRRGRAGHRPGPRRQPRPRSPSAHSPTSRSTAA